MNASDSSTSVLALFLASLLSLSPLSARESGNFPSFLLSESEFVPGWELTRGSFRLGKRDFLYCYGKGFRGEPPETPGFRLSFQGRSYTSLGKFNNAVLRSIRDADLEDTARLRKALLAFRQVERGAPGFWPLLWNLGRLHFLLYEYEKALFYWKRVVAMLPEYSGAHFHLAKAAVRAKKDTLARAHFQRAVELDPAELRSLVGLGDYYLNQRSYHHARLYYDKALQKRPECIGAILGRAHLLTLEDKKNEARRMLRNFLKDHYDPGRPEEKTAPVFYYLGELNYALRDYKRAQRAYRILLQFPESPIFLRVSKRSILKRIQKSGFRQSRIDARAAP